MTVPAEPLIFLKPPSSLIDGGESIVLPPQSEQVEFEGEIGVVDGTTNSPRVEDNRDRRNRRDRGGQRCDRA